MLFLVGSRFLHDAETRYASIEGEALAVAYALNQCKYFVLGCPDLTIVTDHLPLLSILNDRSLADIGNRRLQNLKEKTLSYQFSIQHVPGRRHLGPDAMSRYPVGKPERLILPGEPPETDFPSSPLTSDLRAEVLAGLTQEDQGDVIEDSTCGISEEILTSVLQSLGSLTMSSIQEDYSSTNGQKNMLWTGAKVVQHVISWADVKTSTTSDNTIRSVLELVREGFPDDARQLAPNLRPYYPLRHSLYELDGVLMLGDRIIIPAMLRRAVLAILHAAHQGVDRMKARANATVYWPGITGDLTRIRAECRACNRIAKSNPAQPPTIPAEPQYPFQMLSADYFHHMGHYYAVIVDRYSNWPVVFRSEKDCTGSKGLISHLRMMFSTYGVPEEIASDGAGEFTSAETQSFLKTWQVHHRLSSVAFPHSNCRAELGVKQIKRIIMDNCSCSGSLDVDTFHAAILSYRNTVDPTTKFSPALAVFGRQMRDGLPVLPGHYNPHSTWQEILDHREAAMAKRHVAHHEAWSEHTTKLPPLTVGMKVFVQNQVGNKPRRWDKTGVVMECNKFDQYVVKIDGTGRLTKRNRKFLRRLTPITRKPLPLEEESLKPIPPPILDQLPAGPPVTHAEKPHDHTPATDPVRVHDEYPDMNICYNQGDELHDPVQGHAPPPPSTPAAPCPPTPPYQQLQSTPESPTFSATPAPTASNTPPAPQLGMRPQRARKQNVRYSSDEWDLGPVTNDHPTQSDDLIKDMIYFLASRLGY